MKNLLAKRVKKNNKGFTLVELIIVIAIIAILIVVLAPNYVRYVDRSRWSSDQNACETLLQQVKTAIVEAQNDGSDSLDGSTITVAKTADVDVTGKAKTDKNFNDSMDSADKNWKKVRVKHKNKQALSEDSSGKTEEYNKYVITFSDGGATGKWEN